MAAARGFSRALSLENMNGKVHKMEYAVRGAIVSKAEDYKARLRAGEKLPFSEVTSCNIGNPHSLGQEPLTFFRQVLACCVYPTLLEPSSGATMPADVVQRAKTILSSTEGGIGAYSGSKGLPAVRDSVCHYIETRDNLSHVDPENIYLTNGASAGIAAVLQLLVSNEGDGVMIPIPQYPLYTATLALLGATPVPYYPDEAKGWTLSVDDLRAAVKNSDVEVKAICVINPGNPTGQCLSADNIREILEFAREENLAVLADEVYQTNIYIDTLEFVSFKKVLESMPNSHEILLASFHSTSKGFVGECGMRGGYLEISNLDPNVAAELYKYMSVSLCPNLPGQVLLETMVNPPASTGESYPIYVKERDAIMASLTRRSQIVVDALNEMEGVSCNPVEGALYAFPRITLPPAAIAHAEAAGLAPDSVYAMEMLKATGVCVVPGSGFGQAPGTYHFRTTILPSEERLKTVMQAVQAFHKEYLTRT